MIARAHYAFILCSMVILIVGSACDPETIEEAIEQAVAGAREERTATAVPSESPTPPETPAPAIPVRVTPVPTRVIALPITPATVPTPFTAVPSESPTPPETPTPAIPVRVTPVPTQIIAPPITPVTLPSPSILAGYTPTLPGGEAPLGPNSFVFYGTTEEQNKFAQVTKFGSPEQGFARPPGLLSLNQAAATLKVLVLMVDASDHRFTGTDAQLTTYRDGKKLEIDNNWGPYWLETSFGNQDVDSEMPDLILNLDGAYDDYFNRAFRDVKLRSNGLSTQWTPDPTSTSTILTLASTTTISIEVRDKFDNDIPVSMSLAAGTHTQAEVETACQSVFDAEREDWVTCTINWANELEMTMVERFVVEGAFIRVDSGINLSDIGFDGPVATPGSFDNDAVIARLTGKDVPGDFPVTVPAGSSVTVDVLVRDKDLVTRTYAVTLPAGTYNKNGVETAFLNKLNAEFNWVESFNAGTRRLGLRMRAAYTGAKAGVVVEGAGANQDIIGLDGPVRIDGVVKVNSENTVRGDRRVIVGEALSLYILGLANDAGIDLNTENGKTQADQLVVSELGGFDSFMVLFVHQHLASSIIDKRAGAKDSADYNIAIPTGGAPYKNQVRAGFMIGTGFDSWETWAHELGHNLGFWDIYSKSYHDSQFDRDFDYLNEWAMMDSHWAGSHTTAWHKMYFKKWVSTADVEDVYPPAYESFDTHKYTLVPLEYPMSDYPGAGNADYPAAHVVRLQLSGNHWLNLENRMPGPAYSKHLPGQAGNYIAGGAPVEGGVIVTDTVDPWAPFLYRSPVHVLNLHGTNSAKGMFPGDVLNLSDGTVYPAYDGIKISVTGSELGPGGNPDAMQIEVEWGPDPGYIDLEIRKWDAPNTYGTKDIWIDWPGNGSELYPSSEPPVGNGDDTHWHPDGSALNIIRVRVHNNGTVAAKDVVVRAKINEANMGDKGKYTDIGDSPPKDIAAGGFTDFAFDWRPKESGHTCILARILTFNGPLGDLDRTNEEAQENVNDFAPAAGSPYTPYEFTVNVNSDYSVPADVMLMPTGLITGMVLELEKAYLELGPDEDVTVRGRLFLDENEIPPDPRDRKQQMEFAVHAFIGTEESFLPFGGVSVIVNPGYASVLELEGLVRLADKPEVELADPKLRSRLNDGLKRYQGLSDSYFQTGELSEEYLKETSGFDNPVVVVVGRLDGTQPVPLAGEVVDAVLVDQDRKEWPSTGVVQSDGRFYILFGDPPTGAGKLMLYYFGDQLAPSTLGPELVLIP